MRHSADAQSEAGQRMGFESVLLAENSLEDCRGVNLNSELELAVEFNYSVRQQCLSLTLVKRDQLDKWKD